MDELDPYEELGKSLDAPVALQRHFIRLTGSICAGLVLSQLWSITKDIYRTEPERNGWIWKSQQQWREELGGMGRGELMAARKCLRDLGVLREQRVGAPPIVCCQLDVLRLNCLVKAMNGTEAVNEPQVQNCKETTLTIARKSDVRLY